MPDLLFLAILKLNNIYLHDMRLKHLLIICWLMTSLDACVMKRCRGRQCTVRMEHYHDGYEYRGVNWFTYIFKYKNPRYGKGYPDLVKDPSANVKR